MRPGCEVNSSLMSSTCSKAGKVASGGSHCTQRNLYTRTRYGRCQRLPNATRSHKVMPLAETVCTGALQPFRVGGAQE